MRPCPEVGEPVGKLTFPLLLNGDGKKGNEGLGSSRESDLGAEVAEGSLREVQSIISFLLLSPSLYLRDLFSLSPPVPLSLSLCVCVCGCLLPQACQLPLITVIIGDFSLVNVFVQG